MSLFQPLKNRITKEKEKMSKMDRQQKIAYFKDYYLLKCLLVLVLLVAVGWFIKDLVHNSKITYAGVSVGIDVSDPGSVYLTDGFRSSLDEKYSSMNADFGGNVLIVPQNGDYTETTIEMAFVSQVNAGMFDYFIISKAKFEYFSEYGIYLDISDIKNDEKYTSLDFINDHQGVPSAVRLPKSALSNLGISEDEEVYLCFAFSKDPSKLNTKMIDYLFS